MPPKQRLAVALLCLTAVVGACLVPEVELANKACDASHACASGFTCQMAAGEEVGACVRDEPSAADAAEDAGVADGGPLCTRTDRFCDATGRFVRCKNAAVEVLDDCPGRGAGCDPLRGCLSVCDGGCAGACDLATNFCVPRSACVGSADCPGPSPSGQSCLSLCAGGSCFGSCVNNPTRPPSVAASGSDASVADFSCYAPGDAGFPDASADAGAPLLVTARGFVGRLSGQTTPATVGLQLRVMRNSDFLTQGTAAPALATASVRAGPPGANDAGVGVLDVPGLPANTELVFAVADVSGRDGGPVPTYHLTQLRGDFATQTDAGAVVDNQFIVSVDEADYAMLLNAAGAQPMARRAAVMGQVFDCHPTPLRVEGATVGLNTPVRAYYSLADLLGIAPNAGATANTGRFFFFDVPAAATPWLLGVSRQPPGGSGAELVTVKPFRAVEGGVMIVNVRPPGR